MSLRFVNNGFFQYNSHKGFNNFSCEEIIFIEGCGSYSNIHVFGCPNDLCVSYNLLNIYNELDKEIFYRTHKSYIVNFYHVLSMVKDPHSYKTKYILLSDGSRIACSYKNKDEFIENLNIYRVKFPEKSQIISSRW